eukprot:280225-Chlamydomonas_euryale.AAC.4
MELSATRFCASCRMRSPCGAARGPATAACAGIGAGPYAPISPRVASPPLPPSPPLGPASADSRAICSSSASLTCGAGSIMRPRRRAGPLASLSSAAFASAAGVSCAAETFCRLMSRFTSASSMSLRRLPSSSSTVTGRNSVCSARVAASSSPVSKKPGAGLRSKATSAE